jgi:hypothetical protein
MSFFPSFSQSQGPGENPPALPGRYTLYGALSHHDTSAIGGQHTVDVLRVYQNAHGGSGGEETWLHIDDESVSTVRLRREDVFGRHENEYSRRKRLVCLQYLLFYRCTTSTRVQT